MATEESNNKESPLTDIATSPPPFDLPLDSKVLDNEDSSTFISNQDNSEQEAQVNARTNNRDNYESSELSDLGDDESEAETDKMDFLDEDSNAGDKVLDLNVISKLTELARLKEVDSDEYEENNGTEDVENGLDSKAPLDSVDLKADEDSRTDENTKEESKADEDFSDSEMLLNPKENPEASKEIMEDLVNINKSVGEGHSRRSSKRSLSDIEEKHLKKPKVESEEDANAENDGEDEDDTQYIDNTTKTGNNYAELESHKDDSNADDQSNSGEEEENRDVNNEMKTDQEADEEDTDDIGEADLNESDVDMNEKRILAIEELISIESSFAELRDKLFQDKLNLLEHELQLCLEGSHPELSKIYYKINQFHQDGLKQANSNLNYKLKCIDVGTVATRTSIHQNFLKKLMDYKNDLIGDTTSLWYKINKERNQLDQLVPDYNFTAIPVIPNYTAAVPIEENTMALNGHEVAPLTKKTIKQNTVFELVEQRNNVNCQLGILNGLLQFHGFPSAVTSILSDNDSTLNQELLLRKASEEEINEDLKAMGISI